MRIILASNNRGKIEELKSLIETEIYSLDDIGFTEDIEEFGHTFEQNALIKAQAISKLYPNDIVISDDSGLCVTALDNAPGVYSKRFSGATDNVDAANNQYLLEQMKTIEDRSAKFVTVLCIYAPALEIYQFFRGEVNGEIASDISGEGGFGYDPVFIHNNMRFSQLTREQKNSVSHRGNALKKLISSGVLNV